MTKFEAPLQEGPINNPGWSDRANREWDLLVDQGLATAGQAFDQIVERYGPPKPPTEEPAVDNRTEAERMRLVDPVDFDPNSSAALDSADGDGVLREQAKLKTRNKEIDAEPQTEEQRQLANEKLPMLTKRYGRKRADAT